MSTSKEIIERFHEEVLAKEDLTKLNDFLCDDVTLHSPYLSTPTRGREEFQQFIGAVFQSVSSRQIKVEDIIAEDNKVAVRWALSGHDTGEFMNIPPTGDHVKISIVSIYHLDHGKISEVWALDTGTWRRNEF